MATFLFLVQRAGRRRLAGRSGDHLPGVPVQRRPRLGRRTVDRRGRHRRLSDRAGRHRRHPVRGSIVALTGKMVVVTTTSPPHHGAFVRSSSTFRDWVTADGSLRLSRRGRPLPPLRLARLPLGAPHDHRPPAQGARGRRSRCRSSTRSATSAAGPSRARRAPTATRSTASRFLARGLRRHRPGLPRPRHRAGAVGQADRADRQQRVGRDHPDARTARSTRFTDVDLDLYPRRLAAEIDAINDARLRGPQQRRLPRRLRPHAGGLRRRGARRVRHARLARGAPRHAAATWSATAVTEADWRLFTTLVRFDPVYVTHFRCDRRRIVDYPALSGYLRDLYAVPGVAETVDFDQIRRHYYLTHHELNPRGSCRSGPDIDLSAPHGREALA